jgi:hypothetical protein
MVGVGGCEEGRLTVLLHDGEDLDDNLGRRSDHDLSLSSSFGIDDVVLLVSPSSTSMSPFPDPILIHIFEVLDPSRPSMYYFDPGPKSQESRLTKASLRTEHRTILTDFLVF